MNYDDRIEITCLILEKAVRTKDLHIARQALSAHDAIYRAEARLERLACTESRE